jgi:hypothetical protein
VLAQHTACIHFFFYVLNILNSLRQIIDKKFAHRAVLGHSIGKDLPLVSVESFECLPGMGVAATLSGIKVCTN